MRLGFENKGAFQAAYFNRIAESFFQGRNHNDENSIEAEIVSIIAGLSKAWDAAEEYQEKI